MQGKEEAGYMGIGAESGHGVREIKNWKNVGKTVEKGKKQRTICQNGEEVNLNKKKV